MTTWQPQCWPLRQANSEQSRLFADGHFYTPDGKARLIPLKGLDPVNCGSNPGEFLLNSGRLRDQWHTMTRTGRVPALMQHQSEPFIAIHPSDARLFQLLDGDLVELSNRQGLFRGRAQVTDAQRCGELFVPMHWSGQFSTTSCCDVLFDESRDPISRQPAFKQGRVQLQKMPVTAELVLLSRQADLLSRFQPLCGYGVLIPHAHMFEYRLALTVPVSELSQQFRLISQQLTAALRQSHHALELQQLEAHGSQHWRQAFVNALHLKALMYAGPTLPALDRQWLNQCFAGELTTSARRQLLRGAPMAAADCSALICSCFQVRQQSIQQAIAGGAHCSVSLGERLKCGTGCGSCLPEIRQLLQKALA